MSHQTTNNLHKLENVIASELTQDHYISYEREWPYPSWLKCFWAENGFSKLDSPRREMRNLHSQR